MKTIAVCALGVLFLTFLITSLVSGSHLESVKVRHTGEGALTYHPQRPVPMVLAEELRWFDQDKVEHDILETLPLEKGLLQGQNYSFEVEAGYSLAAGAEVFWHSAIGKAILAGITICIVFFFLMSGAL